MKLYQIELLLIFLLLIIVNTTQITNEIRGQASDNAFSSNSPPLNDQQTKEILGVSQIKQYLSFFGYLKLSTTFFDNVLDKETISAIKTYQKYFNLNVTGDLDTETLQQISLGRCGVPDINFDYFSNPINVSFPKGNKWFPKGTKILTYGFPREYEFPVSMTNVLRNAFARWSRTTKVMNFTETTYNEADIKIELFFYNENVNDVVVGDTLISLELHSKVKSGVIHLDGSKYWVLPSEESYYWSWENRHFDLETVAIHQIGHLLGLEHSSDEESVMYPIILPSKQRKVNITDADNLAIQKLYTFKGNDNSYGFKHFGSSSWFLTLYLGFVFVALLN